MKIVVTHNKVLFPSSVFYACYSSKCDAKHILKPLPYLIQVDVTVALTSFDRFETHTLNINDILLLILRRIDSVIRPYLALKVGTGRHVYFFL